VGVTLTKNTLGIYYIQSTAGGRSGDRGARARLLVATAREHAPERVTIPRPLTEEMIAWVRNRKQIPAL